MKWTKSYRPAIVWLIIIILLTGLPGYLFPTVSPFTDRISLDKLVHFFIFAVLVVTILFGNAKQKNSSPNLRDSIFAILIGIGVGAATELMQEYLFIGRSMSLWDFVADSIGSLGGIIIFRKWEKKILSL